MVPFIIEVVINFADVAQLAEQLICNQQVVGSTPTVGFRGGLSTDMKMGYCVLIEYGRIPEWPKGTDCKSAAICFGGSNPPPPIAYLKKMCYNEISSRDGAVW